MYTLVHMYIHIAQEDLADDLPEAVVEACERELCYSSKCYSVYTIPVCMYIYIYIYICI